VSVDTLLVVIFTSQVEILNGRAAMPIGILLALEHKAGAPFF
jgi:hypothetical protein